MFITKSEPLVQLDGKAKENIIVTNGVLLIQDKEQKITLKFENDKWYTFGEDNKWYFLGYGANPCYKTDFENVLSEEVFANIFEQVAE